MRMNELIWVGNTLYPRWFVILAPIVAVIVLGLVFGTAAAIVEFALR